MALADEFGWQRSSFGDMVRAVARSRGLDDSRAVLQAIGEECETSDATGLCQAVLDAAGWSSGKPLVVDGVRHVRILEILKSPVSPQAVVFVYLEAKEDFRRTRLQERVGCETDSLTVAEAHSTEHAVITRLPHLADIRLSTSTGSIEDLVGQLKHQVCKSSSDTG